MLRLLPLLLLCCAAVVLARDVMIWGGCENDTIDGLRRVRHSFTKVSPFIAGIRRYPDGSVGIYQDSGQNSLKTCGEMIHSLPDDPLTGRRVEFWPCVGASTNDEEAAMMRSVFKNPTRFIQDAVEFAKAYDIQGWNLDFEATGQAPNRNHSFWLETLQFYDVFARELHKHGVKTTVRDTTPHPTTTPQRTASHGTARHCVARIIALHAPQVDVMCAANVTSPVLCNNGDTPTGQGSGLGAFCDKLRIQRLD